MKRFALILALGGVVGASQAANLVSNGDFETNTWGGTNYLAVNPGDTAITGWDVTAPNGSNVDIVGTDYSPYSGIFAVDLIGTPGPGAINQTLTLGSATDYVVSFYGRKTGSEDNAPVTVSLGSASASFTLTDSWALYSFVATGQTGTQTLTLAGNPTNFSNGNTFVDAVSVEAVPEPATMAALGLGLAALARRRRNRA